MAMRVRDDLNRDVVFLRPPQRIVSLVPSDTETLFALGVSERVVGRTRYCVEPASSPSSTARLGDIPVCGGTKDVDVAAVAALEPDLVLCNQEENARPHLEALAQSGHQVFVSFPRRAADGIAHMARLARHLGVADRAEVRELVRRGHQVISEAQRALSQSPPEERLRVFVPIWKEPLMTLSGDTFGSDMLAMAGAENVFGDRTRRYPLAADLGKQPPLEPEKLGARDIRYPRISDDELLERQPDAILLPDEPYSFGPADADEFRERVATARAVRLWSGKDLFWYGARIIEALPRLRAVIAELAALVTR